MMEGGWQVIVGGGAFGWAIATIRRLRSAPPLFPGEQHSATGMIAVSAALVTIGLARLFGS
jgi:hypothetical protein